jgi:hypothetical protein
MTKLVNPSAKLRIYSDTTYEIEDLYLEFSVNKDLDEEPNSATVIVYNLASGSRNSILEASNKSAPIEIYATPAGSSGYVMAFRGEIDTVRSVNTRPGWETEITCTSQQVNHRSKYVDEKEFAAGTPVNQVIEFFLGEIGLPKGQIDELPTVGTTLSQSFSGPAFKLLQHYVYDFGMYCYILDGTINITDNYERTGATVKQIPVNRLLSEPQPTSRNDRSLIRMITAAETIKRVKNEPFRKGRRKKTRQQKEVGRSDYVEYTATDTLVEGMDFEFLLQPDLQPDSIINVPLVGIDRQLWRVKEVEHSGNTETFDESTSYVSADKYDDTSGDLEASLPKIAPSDAISNLDNVIYGSD